MSDVASYERGIAEFRGQFERDSSVRAIFFAEAPPPVLLGALIHFCALGVAMTEPVEEWIYRAGVACEARGLAAIGSSLKKSAKLEHAHHLMMIEDAKALVHEWNARYPSSALDPGQLLALPSTPGVLWYRAIHEEYLRGPRPYVQIAFMHEIERLAGAYGEALLAGVARVLGEELSAQLSFVHFHVANDVGHANLSEHLLEKVLGEVPDALDALLTTGKSAIASYRTFLSDCVRLGSQLAASLDRVASSVAP